MVDTIRQRLIKAEVDLMSAYFSGENSLSQFDSTWSSLLTDVSLATTNNQVDHETLAMAHDVASNVSTIADCFLGVENYLEDWSHHLRSDWEQILTSMAKCNISDATSLRQTSISVDCSPTLHRSSMSADTEHSSPSFIAPCYAWVLKNIHNPYPSTEIKNSIASSTNAPISSINAWFINVRRRMGWTALCREHFHNCRADAIDAAYRALVEEDPKRQLPETVTHAFVEVKVAAEGLYSASFTKSALAGKLDAVLKDMTEEDRLRLEEEKKQKAEDEKKRKEEEKEMRKRQRALEREASKTRQAFLSYPSPDHSRTSSPVPTLEESLTDEESEDEDDDIVPPIVAGHKRRASSSLESSDFRNSPCEERPMKRLRQTKSTLEPLSDACITGLPSPVPSAEDSPDVFDFWSLESPEPTPSIPTPAPPPSRKRRLSDADAQGPPKRSRGPFIGPRLHAVSDPLPKPVRVDASHFDNWFKQLDFEIPPPVTSDAPDSSAPLDVSLFSDWSFLDNFTKAPAENTAQFPTPLSSQSDELPQTEVSSHAPETSTQINITPVVDEGLSTDDLFKTFDPNYFVDPLSLLSAPLQAPSSQDTSSPYPTMDLLNTDWTQLFSSQPDTFDLTHIPDLVPSQSQEFSQLSDIDLSMLQLPLSTSDIITPDESAQWAEKQAKFDQLRALEEAARKLQQELGVVA
ncbi:C-terminal domain of homeodomain 1-domain-containing protein [Hygrophoropsis aurantiaca]|uniref:C-terminal domain of homeodomain 1-domain-containing protein n=1 Tax=Hygrophoropsis aurantiaca TaxID=72124 RepID=A0ACB8A3T3_9AGAM|nr:C-terminal domain of homeodomain 1-domain-containing protein [Hygrophoropsis aurantiaca]